MGTHSRKRAVLVSGANGEMGHGLITRLAARDEVDVLALDIRELDPTLRDRCQAAIVGDVLDRRLLDRLVSEFEIDAIFHLAALLSMRAEFSPETAHEVNVQGTLNLLKLAVEQARWHGRSVRFLFPSSIAVYGLPDTATKRRVGAIHEDAFNFPTTMYGCNKLYCEQLGRYYARHYRQLAIDRGARGVDFRGIRFPGLVSAFTVPSGGTSDYAPDMIHAAAQGEAYACFVREDTRIPFMAMPDAIDALLALVDADQGALSRVVYNITAFNPSAGEFSRLVKRAFPKAEITFQPDNRRQAIIDSWPESVDDSAARSDWGFAPRFRLETAFSEYLLPNIKRRYANP